MLRKVMILTIIIDIIFIGVWSTILSKEMFKSDTMVFVSLLMIVMHTLRIKIMKDRLNLKEEVREEANG